jgi:hypothetical protein
MADSSLPFAFLDDAGAERARWPGLREMLVKEDEETSDRYAQFGEAIGVTIAALFEQSVRLHFRVNRSGVGRDGIAAWISRIARIGPCRFNCNLALCRE